ncbi:MAG: type-F conjugative transfer system pilin assembly protein TrbC [Chlamydiota bacterium]
MRSFSVKWLLFLAPILPLWGDLFEEEIQSCKRDGDCSVFDHQEETGFFAFVSFSMPDSLWLEMSKGLEENGGTFVIEGIPNDDFQNFLEKVFDFRKMGILAPISIDPDAFEEYQITAVPTFVLEQKKGFRKVVGNVSVDYALRKLRGED